MVYVIPFAELEKDFEYLKKEMDKCEEMVEDQLERFDDLEDMAEENLSLVDEILEDRPFDGDALQRSVVDEMLQLSRTDESEETVKDQIMGVREKLMRLKRQPWEQGARELFGGTKGCSNESSPSGGSNWDLRGEMRHGHSSHWRKYLDFPMQNI